MIASFVGKCSQRRLTCYETYMKSWAALLDENGESLIEKNYFGVKKEGSRQFLS